MSSFQWDILINPVHQTPRFNLTIKLYVRKLVLDVNVWANFNNPTIMMECITVLICMLQFSCVY